MVRVLDQLQKTLQQAGYSTTAARQAVFEALQGKEPMSMAELVSAAHGIDRASVYRTIALFEQLGIVQRLPIGWKYKLELTDRFSHHHHHLTCTQCGKVIPFDEDAELETRLLAVAQSINFLQQNHQIEIRGLCVECKNLF